MGAVISVTNQKGGVGKTMTVACLASILSAQEYKVLTIDLDPQRNLDMMAGEGVAIPRDDEETLSLLHVMNGQCSLRDAIVHTVIGDVVRASSFLSQWRGNTLVSTTEYEQLDKEALLALMRKRYEDNYGQTNASVLSEKLRGLRDEYDFIFLDTNPSLMVLTVNALFASDYVLIPVVTDGASKDAVEELWTTIQTVRQHNTERKIKVAGILVTRYQSNSYVGKNFIPIFESMAHQMDSVLFRQKIRIGTIALECLAAEQDLINYNRRCVASVDYLAFAEEFKARIQEMEGYHV